MLRIQKLQKALDSKQRNVINNINLTVSKGSITAIIGESGSGKTTLVRLITGLILPDAGSIELQGEIVSSTAISVPPEQRKVGMVFQDYALFPHLTVAKNIGYGITSKKNAQHRIQEVLRLVGLIGYENRYPHQLSGGQQQRVALARALAPEPQLLILDEPFSNLDVALKLQLRNEVFDIIKKTEVTVIFVTHDTQDAMVIADNIVVLKKGDIIQQGTTETLFKKPKNEYVASLFSDIICLTKEDLHCFNFTANKEFRYAMRLSKFEVEKGNYSAAVTITRSVFLGTYFINTCKLSNGTNINFISEVALEGIINLGFEATSLLEFQDK